jgi:vacuolar-type H+-ATPase subunit E/Vma4
MLAPRDIRIVILRQQEEGAMAEQNIHEPPERSTFEDVWAMFRKMAEESERKFQKMREASERERRERREEFEREFRKRAEESERKFQKMREESDKQLKETWRIVGNLSNKLGIVVEQLVLTNILEKFNELGYGFSKMGPNIRIEDTKKNIIMEIDAMLENGEYALAIEVKTQLNVKDVDEHLERMDKLRRYADDRHDTRKFLGAVAGAIVAGNVKAYALKKGFYVIKQSGDTVSIENPGGFQPREW